VVGGTHLLSITLYCLTSGHQHDRGMELRAIPGCLVGRTRLLRYMGHLGTVQLSCILMVGSAPARGSSEQHGT